MTLCNEPIRCWDNTVRGCRLDANHTGGHNPFARLDSTSFDRIPKQREPEQEFSAA